METDMEERLKMAEEYIHQQYVDECKQSGWDFKRKARAYSKLPQSMHEPVLDWMTNGEGSDYIQELMSNIYEHKRWTAIDYDNAPPYVRNLQPKWMYIMIEDAVAGSVEDYIKILKTDFKEYKNNGFLGECDDTHWRNYVKMMELMHEHCQKLCALSGDDHEEGKD